MTKLFKNCFCTSRKQHVRELQADHAVVFDRVSRGSDEINLCIEISNEINEIQAEGY